MRKSETLYFPLSLHIRERNHKKIRVLKIKDFFQLSFSANAPLWLLGAAAQQQMEKDSGKGQNKDSNKLITKVGI